MKGLQKMATAARNSGRRIADHLAHAGHAAALYDGKSTPLSVSDFEALTKSPRKEITKTDRS